MSDRDIRSQIGPGDCNYDCSSWKGVFAYILNMIGNFKGFSFDDCFGFLNVDTQVIGSLDAHDDSPIETISMQQHKNFPIIVVSTDYGLYSLPPDF